MTARFQKGLRAGWPPRAICGWRCWQGPWSSPPPLDCARPLSHGLRPGLSAGWACTWGGTLLAPGIKPLEFGVRFPDLHRVNHPRST